MSGGLDPMGAPPRRKKQRGQVAASKLPLSPRDPQKNFAARCQTCHQTTGQGVPVISAAAGSEFTNGGSYAGMIVLKGLQDPVKVKGQQYGSSHAAVGQNLTDQELPTS
jgi:mono/diheme cytochrome c family protein